MTSDHDGMPSGGGALTDVGPRFVRWRASRAGSSQTGYS